MDPLVFALPGNQVLSRRMGEVLGWPLGDLDVRRFPDGESHLRFVADVAGRDIVLVCTLAQPDDKLIRLYLAASIARELGARRCMLVVPYLAYMRQDARFQPGQGITSAHVARLISNWCDGLITVDPHLHRHHDLGEIYRVPTGVVHAAPSIADWIAAHVERPVIVGPDGESEQWVAQVAGLAHCPYTVLRKTRRGDRDVEVSVPDAAVLRGRTPVLVDDIASTARTMIAAATHLRAAGPVPPVCIAVHPIFAGDALSKLQAVGVANIVSCNTIEHETNAIDMSLPLARALGELMR